MATASHGTQAQGSGPARLGDAPAITTGTQKDNRHPRRKKQRSRGKGEPGKPKPKPKPRNVAIMPDAAAAGDRSRPSREDVKISKALSWVLRHEAPSLGLALSPDGYVPVESVLSLDHPRFRDRDTGRPRYAVEDVRRVVDNNDKRRFRLEERRAVASGGEDSVVLCIRANQGHSVEGLEAEALLTPLTSEELSDPGMTIVHGTTRRAWEDHIRHEGLSRMTRNHVHFAAGLPRGADAPISGMRTSSEIHIYVDGPACARDGVPFYRSDNGVILTAGPEGSRGMLPTCYFEKVVYAPSGRVLWEKKGKGAVAPT